MKVEIIKDGLLIVPDTDFEADYINKNFERGELTCFVKSGMTAKELIGIKVCCVNEKEVKN
jgi:hypothetical protein